MTDINDASTRRLRERATRESQRAGSGETVCEHRAVKLTGSGIGVIVNCERCGVRFLPPSADHTAAMQLAEQAFGVRYKLEEALRELPSDSVAAAYIHDALALLEAK